MTRETLAKKLRETLHLTDDDVIALFLRNGDVGETPFSIIEERELIAASRNVKDFCKRCNALIGVKFHGDEQ